ncbi:hypothetical protein EDB84DRAFT_1559525 [Lactarius hengduanensis]|nr:hypothetical protein EDB84DRAFT_1560456 [Lactarius hengduanensis]KAH9041935.1 hypothetical protein EDB84DRAFT_1559525 [Lactarius hengduanensis]
MAIAIVASPAGAEGQWRGRGPTGQRLGDVNDGGCFAKEAVMNSPSKPKPSPPDDARVRDPRKRGTEFIVFVLDFELLDLVQFIHVEYCFNELFVHDDQLVYLVYPTSSSTPDTPVSTPDTKPSFTTGNLRLRIR